MAGSKLTFNKRRQRVRSSLKKRAGDKPRLSVFRSGNHMYAQVIDDKIGHTIVAASTLDSEVAKKTKKTSTVEAAKVIGKLIAERAVEANVKKVVFDRGGYIYHGRVKALAEAAREGGLKF